MQSGSIGRRGGFALVGPQKNYPETECELGTRPGPTDEMRTGGPSPDSDGEPVVLRNLAGGVLQQCDVCRSFDKAAHKATSQLASFNGEL